MIRFKLLLFFSLAATAVIGQKEVVVEVSSDTPRVGDVFKISCTVQGSIDFPEEKINQGFYPAKYLSVDTSIHETLCKDVEVLETIDSSFLIDGVQFYQREYEVIAWDSCELSLLGFDYRFGDTVIKSQQVYIKVSFYDQKDNLEIYDLKETFSGWESDSKKFQFTTAIYVILALVLLFIISVFIWLKYFKKNQRSDTNLSVEEKTLAEIQVLYAAELWRNDRIQEHFVQFSFILRDYLTLRFGVSFLDKTTHQSNLLLKHLDLNTESRRQIEKLLLASDYVKFADSTIADQQIESLKLELIKIVLDTSPLIEEDQ